MTDKTLPPAIFLMGPTASGKTDLAMRIADNIDVEIISVDSALIYKGMDIGTAKPSAEELAAYPHHLIDIRDPRDVYSAADFRHDALVLMADISARGKTPLLVGGTMMYFKMLLEGMSDLPEANADVRAAIEKDAEQHGWEYVHQQLAAVDSESAARIHPNDPQRLQRALEVYRISGKSMTEHRALEKKNKGTFPYQAVQIAIAPNDRQVLHHRIEKRFVNMLQSGFEEEVRLLYERGDLNVEMPSMRSVGYRQMWLYFDGLYKRDEMQEKGIIATRQLAKRQFTWLRGWQELNWLYTNEADVVTPQNKQQLIAALLQDALKLIEKPFK